MNLYCKIICKFIDEILILEPISKFSKSDRHSMRGLVEILECSDLALGETEKQIEAFFGDTETVF